MKKIIVTLFLTVSTLFPIEWDSKTQGDLHEAMVMSILEQRPDRYEFIRSVLKDEPKRVRAMVMRINWKIDHKWDIKVTETVYTLMTAAVLTEDMEMIDLLLSYGDDICYSPSPICALYIAKKYNKQAALERLYQELIRIQEERERGTHR
jgi:hypothetical protein